MQRTESRDRNGLLKTQLGSAARFGEEFRSLALFMAKTSFCASFRRSTGESSIPVEEEPHTGTPRHLLTGTCIQKSSTRLIGNLPKNCASKTLALPGQLTRLPEE